MVFGNSQEYQRQEKKRHYQRIYILQKVSMMVK